MTVGIKSGRRPLPPGRASRVSVPLAWSLTWTLIMSLKSGISIELPMNLLTEIPRITDNMDLLNVRKYEYTASRPSNTDLPAAKRPKL